MFDVAQVENIRQAKQYSIICASPFPLSETTMFLWVFQRFCPSMCSTWNPFSEETWKNNIPKGAQHIFSLFRWDMESSSSKTNVEPISTWYLHMMPNSHTFYVKWDGWVLLKLFQESPEKPARPKKMQPYTWKPDDVTENFWPRINVEANGFLFVCHLGWILGE